jgi:uncharacterized protein (TIGR03435 family)
MVVALFLIEWAFRSSILILSGALLLRVLRVKDSSIRLAAWTAMLGGSLLIPALAASLPSLPFDMNTLAMRAIPARSLGDPAIAGPTTATPARALSRGNSGRIELGYSAAEHAAVTSGWFERRTGGWIGAAAILYLVIAVTLVLRLVMGLAASLRLLRDSRSIRQTTEGIEIRESSRIHAPVTLGIVRPAIVLPADWHQWDDAKRDAVLAHERSHVMRRDPALQLLSLLHRALLWHSPLSWFVHKRIVQTAEEVSDDAAVAATGNRVGYAEVLLEFMEQSALRGVDEGGVAMARYGLPERRIHRIVYGTTLSRGVTRWSLAAILALASPLAYLVATAQTRPEFEIADVHFSQPRGDGRRVLLMEGGEVRGSRYEIYNATLVDLIRTAYSLEASAVLGGPSWLALDRFDVIAKAPAKTSAISISLMLQSLLADRFKLVVHKDTRPMPAWVLSKGTDKPKLRPAAGASDSGCRMTDENKRVSCRNVTMDAFASWIREGRMAALPVVNLTGIEKSWDFDLRYTRAGQKGISEMDHIRDAVNKQLDLKLEIQNIPQPVLLVESVNRNPTANAPDIQKHLPPDPIEFEVASIRPCQAVDVFGSRTSPSGLVTTGCMGLDWHIDTAWDLCIPAKAAPNHVLDLCGGVPGAPSWIESKVFNIVAKAPIALDDGYTGDPKYQAMLRNLLVKRFKMRTHYEDRLVDVNTLVAENPKLRKADPSSRTECKSNGTIPGIPTVIACQNVTMAQFAEELNSTMGAILMGRTVVDATGIQGTWDLTLTYRLRPAPTPAMASDPTGDLSLLEALKQQLGLKLEGARRRMPVFVVDHIEENPIEN